jgi:hypothetical protein
MLRVDRIVVAVATLAALSAPHSSATGAVQAGPLEQIPIAPVQVYDAPDDGLMQTDYRGIDRLRRQSAELSRQGQHQEAIELLVR